MTRIILFAKPDGGEGVFFTENEELNSADILTDGEIVIVDETSDGMDLPVEFHFDKRLEC